MFITEQKEKVGPTAGGGEEGIDPTLATLAGACRVGIEGRVGGPRTQLGRFVSHMSQPIRRIGRGGKYRLVAFTVYGARLLRNGEMARR